MGARGIYANELVVAIQRDPVAGAADGVAIRRGNGPSDVLLRGQGAPAAGDRTEVAAIALLVRHLRIPRRDKLLHVPVSVLTIDTPPQHSPFAAPGTAPTGVGGYR